MPVLLSRKRREQIKYYGSHRIRAGKLPVVPDERKRGEKRKKNVQK